MKLLKTKQSSLRKQSFLDKTKRGGMEGFLSTAICMFTLIVVLAMAVNYITLVTVKRSINNYGRDMLLRLEEQGELLDADVSEFENKLADEGINDYSITFNGNNTEVGHGETVSVEIEAEALPSEIGLHPVFNYVRDKYTFHIYLESVMKG